MSKYAEYSTKLTDCAHLVGALQDLGYTVEVHDTPQVLYGYHGDARTQTANVIVRRQFVGEASNDVGFLKQPDGSYAAIISDYDQACTFNPARMGELKQTYTERRQMALAKQKGYVFQGRKVVQTDKGPTVQLVFAKR